MIINDNNESVTCRMCGEQCKRIYGTYYHRDNVENKKRELKRDDDIKNSGYEVMHVSEKEYLENKEFIILKISNYILKKKQLENA